VVKGRGQGGKEGNWGGENHGVGFSRGFKGKKGFWRGKQSSGAGGKQVQVVLRNGGKRR